MAKKTTRTRGVGLATEARILEAAEEVFARYGFEGARMDQVAERAGVEKANIYYYFASKEQLYRALIERILNQLVTEVRDFLALPSSSPWERLDIILDIFFRITERYQGLVGLAFGEMLHPPRKKAGRSPIWKMLEQVESVGKVLIAQGIEAGVFREQDPASAVITLEGAVFYYFLLPDDRLLKLTGGKKFEAKALEKHKNELRAHLRRILEK